MSFYRTCLQFASSYLPATALLLGSLAFVGCTQVPEISMNAGINRAAALEEETMTCPLDGRLFRFRADGFSQAKGTTLDMQPYGADDLPWPLPQCPDNGFVLYKQRFSAMEIQRLQPLIGQQDFAGKPLYERAFLMAHSLNEPLPLQLRLLQIAAWQGGDKYRRQALPILQKLSKDTAQSERSRLNYLLLQAEYQRRLGYFDAAQQSIEKINLAKPEALKSLIPILECQKTLITQNIRRASPIPAENALCGDHIS